MPFYYGDKEVVPGTPEADELARKILTSLYRCAAMSRGLDPDALEIGITRKDEHTDDAACDSGHTAGGPVR